MSAHGSSETRPDGEGDPSRPPEAARSLEWLEGGLAALDSDGRVVGTNAPLCAWLGVSQTDAAGKDFWGLLSERCPAWNEDLRRLRDSQNAFETAELRLDLACEPDSDSGRQRDSRWFRVETARAGGAMFVRLASILPRGSELSDSGWGPALSSEAAGREMFVRLLRAEAQVEKLARYWPGVIFSQRPDFSFESVTGRIEELTGRTAEEWRRQSGRFWDAVHEADAVELQHQMAAAVRGRRSLTSTFRVRNLVSGRVSYVMEHRQPVVSGSGLLLGYEGVWLDVTRQTLAERLLTSAAWKETLAVLTMGLAHDFSNVMAGIHSLSESFLSQLDASHPFSEGLGLIRKSSMQASQLVHRIVNLHLGKPGERNYHDLNQVVDELLELVRKVIPRRIEIVSELCRETLAVYVDAFEFRQVIINLALNAADAMPERGRLVLRSSRLTERPKVPRLHGVEPRFPCACLTVQDSGCGIKSGHLDLIFDPFFTTKSGGKGSGLGLYNARLFVEKHRGAIWVESEEGRGAAFHVCLPETDFSEAEAADATSPPLSERRALLLYGPACALFDETAEMLRTEGYHVATAHSLERAAGFLSAGDYTYNGVLLLTESSGLVLAPHVASWRRLCPGLRVILRPIGRDRDELEPALLGIAECVLTPGLSRREVLEKLRSTLHPSA